ncbi:hypothetical protein GLOTRDRAFT_136007 [Gloeophyllum trabeum ATCC 11539]|uniref:Uncharacterized protein n=1 Tax=Gloeophyllum trabeum (strain ATCC 11539 / FP-39264 / Madison 617) TaxID=670483 RepID=S7S006_GLOTA|nr:uncharacterized protein GLOTRDRAFT_136007 [Gloeophyllum trabeum ATCC 11539]EPQ59014.1 hypothetical protein GLOTRDRAFT_136007 [Gloeophyllum trabeum ATCC 11539]
MVLPVKIEWESYDEHGRRRIKPPASTIHGWLVKWRGTFSGDEELRRQGIREMREARAIRAWRQQKGRTKKGSTSALGLSFLSRGPSTSKPKKSQSRSQSQSQSSSRVVSRSNTRHSQSRSQSQNQNQSRQVIPHPTHHRHGSSRQNSGSAGQKSPQQQQHRPRGSSSHQSPRPSARRANTSRRSSGR